MKEFRIFYIVLVVISLAMSFIYLSRLTPIIFMVLAFCPLISFVFLVISYFSLEIKLKPEETVTEKREDGLITITVRNRFIFPVSPVRLTGMFQGAGENSITKKILLADISPFSTVTLNLPFSMPYRGEYRSYLEKAEILDIFKLFKLKKKLDIPVRIIVLPRVVLLQNINNINESESENLQNVMSFHNKDIFSSLREYREGDSLRFIHWKLSAKQDNLIVKQMEQSVNNNSVIYCDFTETDKIDENEDDYNEEKKHRKNKKDYTLRTKSKPKIKFKQKPHNKIADYDLNNESELRAADTVIETALAITRRIISDKNSIRVCWAENDEQREYQVDDYNSFQRLFYKFSVLPAGVSKKPFHELLELHNKNISVDNNERIIYIITHRLDRKLLATLEELGFAVRKGVVLIIPEYTFISPLLLDYISNETKIILKIINDDNINDLISDI